MISLFSKCGPENTTLYVRITERLYLQYPNHRTKPFRAQPAIKIKINKFNYLQTNPNTIQMARILPLQIPDGAENRIAPIRTNKVED
ncbi:hypothetical protein [Pseudomonas sp. zfem003]|uniref:hypothetical protein n=1 Tax=Pseudomonas sp. zfem003 TaxID=3078198 RepID=UPI002927BC4F|nr:hypothetical protein [Pseudomonas sp. zfem003]MDU9400353.1 hypothetical protein [Pseudomonas sp. zfem003]